MFDGPTIRGPFSIRQDGDAWLLRSTSAGRQFAATRAGESLKIFGFVSAANRGLFRVERVVDENTIAISHPERQPVPESGLSVVIEFGTTCQMKEGS